MVTVRSKSDMIAKGKVKYEAGIKAVGGAAKYRQCGAEGGMNTAICLAAEKASLDEGDWAAKWATAMNV